MEDKEIINQEKAESPVDDTMGLKMSGHILIKIKKPAKNLLINVMLFTMVTWRI